MTQSMAFLSAPGKLWPYSGEAMNSASQLASAARQEPTGGGVLSPAEAGAECLYAPGIRTLDQVRAVVAAVAPKPVNVLVGGGWTTLASLKDVGVRRISVGGALARAAWTGFLGAAQEIASGGTFVRLGEAIPFADIEQRIGE